MSGEDKAGKPTPRRYYDFSYILNSDTRISVAERRAALEMAESLEVKDAIITCAVNSFVMLGDLHYEKDKESKDCVAHERGISDAMLVLRLAPSMNHLVSHVQSKMDAAPRCAKLYTKLFDFEMILLKRKHERLTSRK